MSHVPVPLVFQLILIIDLKSSVSLAMYYIQSINFYFLSYSSVYFVLPCVQSSYQTGSI